MPLCLRVLACVLLAAACGPTGVPDREMSGGGSGGADDGGSDGMGDAGPGRMPSQDDPRALSTWDCAEVLAESSCEQDETLPFGWDADEVVDLEPLRGIRCIEGTLDLNGGIDAPEDLDALSSLEVVCGDLKIGSADELRDLTAFASLRALGGLWLYHLDRLESLAGLEGVASLTGRVDLAHMPAFEDPDALAGHRHLRSMWLEDLPALTTLGPLADVEEVDAEVILRELPGFEVLAFASLRHAGWLGVQSNPNLVELDIGPLTSADSLGLSQLPELVRVVGTGALASLRRDNGSPAGLTLYDLPELTELSALRNLGTVEQLRMEGVGAQADFTALGALTHIGAPWGLQSVDIRNTALTSLPGLDNVIAVDGRITIVLNHSLPGAEAAAWANQFAGVVHKVGGNLGDPMPGWTECPWRDDDECDAADNEDGQAPGLGLCVSDPEDCTMPTCHEEC